MKICGRCRKKKPLSKFHKSTARGYQTQCKTCKTEVKREWIKDNREKVKWNAFFTKYRLRKADFEQILSSQDGVCAVCRADMKKIQVDHDHKTGAVRGLLCLPCNHFVGWMEKYKELIPAVQKYLRNDPILQRLRRSGSHPDNRGFESP